MGAQGIEIAGHSRHEISMQDFCQSTYVFIFTPATSIGYGWFTSNGRTCVVGAMKYS